MRTTRILAGVLALLGWAGLVVRYSLFIAQVGFGLGSRHFVGYSPIRSNTEIATIAT